jgi:hypothetical protein
LHREKDVIAAYADRAHIEAVVIFLIAPPVAPLVVFVTALRLEIFTEVIAGRIIHAVILLNREILVVV